MKLYIVKNLKHPDRLYVGCTKNTLQERWAAHVAHFKNGEHTSKPMMHDWLKDPASLQVIELYEGDDAHLLEQQLIELFKPYYNIRGAKQERYRKIPESVKVAVAKEMATTTKKQYEVAREFGISSCTITQIMSKQHKTRKITDLTPQEQKSLKLDVLEASIRSPRISTGDISRKYNIPYHLVDFIRKEQLLAHIAVKSKLLEHAFKNAVHKNSGEINIQQTAKKHNINVGKFAQYVKDHETK